MPALPRDKDATWQTTSAFCGEHGLSRARLLWDLKNKRVLYRIIPSEGEPEGEPEINWHDPLVQESLDVDASQVSTFDEERARAEFFRGRGITVVSNGAKTFDIEVSLPPLAAEVTADADKASSPSADAPLPSPTKTTPPLPPVERWRKPPPLAAIETAARAVVKNYQPDNPPTQAEWWAAFNAKLGEPATRAVALKALGDFAPQLKRTPGQKPNRR